MKHNKLLIGLLCALAGALVAAPPASAAFPQLWTESGKKTLLRSVTTLPKNQPDALEFVNSGEVIFAQNGNERLFCNELEFGTTVLVNSGAAETKLALPFGVAEGDSCFQTKTRFVFPALTYFDTGATGAVPATITFTGPPLEATMHKLKLSQFIKGFGTEEKTCTVDFEGAKAKVEDVTEGFVEESPPNLSMTFAGAPILITCGKTKEKSAFSAAFFLETMSTETDTAFLG